MKSADNTDVAAGLGVPDRLRIGREATVRRPARDFGVSATSWPASSWAVVSTIRIDETDARGVLTRADHTP